MLRNHLTRMYELTERHGAGAEGTPWTPPSVLLKEAPTHVRSQRQRQASRSRDSGHRRRRREGERRSQLRRSRERRSWSRKSRSRERRSRSRERRSRSREKHSRSRERRSRRETAEAVRASPDLSPKLPPGVPQAASTHSERDAWLGVLTQAVSRAVGVSPPSGTVPAAPPSYQASPSHGAYGPPGYSPCHPGGHHGCHGTQYVQPMPWPYGHPPHPHPPCHGHPAAPRPFAPLPGYPPMPHYYPSHGHVPNVHYTYAPHPHYPGYYMPVPAMPARAREPSSDEDRKREKQEPPPPAKFDDDHWEEPRSRTKLKLFGEECSDEFRQMWKYPLSDESRRSFAGYIPKVLNEELCRSFFTKIKDSCEWKQPEGAFGQIPRKTCWMVKGNCKCKYRYGGLEVQPEEFPKWMIELMEVVLKPCGIAQNDWPNSCNLNLYEDGGMTVGWHSDDERLFQGKFRDCRIISLSLGATRKFELRRNWPEDREDRVQRVVLNTGDLLTMEGMFQKHFQHRVPREDVKEPRINLTWRWVKKHIPDCPAGRSRRV